MAKAKSSILKDRKSRNLIARVLKENFRLYVGRYLLAFLLMGCTALATGLSVFMMKAITAVVFGSHDSVKVVPDIGKGSPTLVAEWIQKINAFFSSFFASTRPGMFEIFCVAIGIILIFLVKGISEYGSSVILNRIGNNIVARQQRRVGDHILKQSLAFFVHFHDYPTINKTS